MTQRPAATLVGLAERAGMPFHGGVLVQVRLRRDDVGAMAATTRGSVSRHPAGLLVRDVEDLRHVAWDAAPEAGARPGSEAGEGAMAAGS